MNRSRVSEGRTVEAAERAPPRPLVSLGELTGVLASGEAELLLVRLPRGFNADRLHDQDLTADDLALDGVLLEKVTNKGISMV
jgi:hypothetical protein